MVSPPAYHQDSFVDHELSKNLDSTYAFEGPEKLLELWFWKSENDIPACSPKDGLRSIKMDAWAKMLDLVNCKILSMKSSPFMDAYLLSESSLFVFPHKLILKTCGTTTTLACLDELFQMTRQICQLTSKEIYRVFYSRRSFMFPEKQIHVHKDWKHEVSLLNQHFMLGKSYVVGNFASDDHWFLYVGGKEDDDCREGASAKAPFLETFDNKPLDQTFEILMTELDPECASKFIYSRQPGEDVGEDHDLGHELGRETMIETDLDSVFQPEKRVGGVGNGSTHLPSPSLSDISEDEDCEGHHVEGHGELIKEKDANKSVVVPGINTGVTATATATATTSVSSEFEFLHDAFAFTPCGFSSNSICSNIGGGYYYTLHITPESGWSYASFETNYPFQQNGSVDVLTVLTKVLKIFRPRKFSLTLISEICDEHQSSSQALTNSDVVLKEFGYKKSEKAVYDLKNEYNLLYLNFVKA